MCKFPKLKKPQIIVISTLSLIFIMAETVFTFQIFSNSTGNSESVSETISQDFSNQMALL